MFLKKKKSMPIYPPICNSGHVLQAGIEMIQSQGERAAPSFQSSSFLPVLFVVIKFRMIIWSVSPALACEPHKSYKLGLIHLCTSSVWSRAGDQ